MRHQSLRVKVIGLVLSCLVVTAGAFLVLLQIHFSAQEREVAVQSVADARRIFEDNESADVNKMSGLLETILSNDSYALPYTEAYRSQLLERTRPLYEQLKQRHNITNWLFFHKNPPPTVFLRLSQPEKINDPVQSWIYDECVRTGSPVYGMDTMTTGFGLNVMMPHRDRSGRLLGYVELGEDIGRFVRHIKALSDDECVVVLKKNVVNKAGWVRFRELNGQRNNWNDLKDLLVAARTTKDEKLLSVPLNMEGIQPYGEVLAEVFSGPSVYVCGAFPLLGADGQRSGAVFIARDISAQIVGLRHVKWVSGILVLLVMTGVGFLMSWALNRWILRRLNAMTEAAKHVVAGRYNSAANIQTRDEMEQFQILFEQFCKIFIEVLEGRPKT